MKNVKSTGGVTSHNIEKARFLPPIKIINQDMVIKGHSMVLDTANKSLFQIAFLIQRVHSTYYSEPTTIVL